MKKRWVEYGHKTGWANVTNIMQARAGALEFVFKDGRQIAPVFHTMEEGLDFVIDEYNGAQSKSGGNVLRPTVESACEFVSL